MRKNDWYKSVGGDGSNDVYIIGVTHNIGPIENVQFEYEAHAGERRAFTYWRDRLGVEHNDLSLAKNNIDPIAAMNLLRKYNQRAGLVLKPDGMFDFLLVEDPANKEKAGKMDEIIELEWGEYWPGCVRKKGMSIRSILEVQRWGLSIARLPKEVQDKIDEAEGETAVSLEEQMHWSIGNEEADENGKRFVCLTPVNDQSETAEKVGGKIFALSEGEEENYKLMGTAEGESLAHCAYLGFKYTRIFFERVCAYKIGVAKDPRMKIAVTFYEKKPN